MAFSTTASRFELLMDDAADPFVKKAKAKTPNPVKATKPGSNSSSSQQKKAKDKKNQAKTGVNAPTQKAQKVTSQQAATRDVSHGGDFSANGKNVKQNDNQRPKVKSDVLDWDEWEKRDTEFVTTTYQSQLEEALLQSKLEFQKQKQNQLTTSDDASTSKQSKSKKKKKHPVPITEFHEMVSSSVLNANKDALYDGSGSVDEESLIDRLRLETHFELLKEKQHAEEKAILLSRNAHFINGNLNVSPTRDIPRPSSDEMGEGDVKLIILQLEEDKHRLEVELQAVKARYKKLLGLLSDADLREKVLLLRDLEKMTESNQELTKLNQDLNDELKNVYSQLEQERSRSHTAMMEVKKMNELSRRGRTQSQMELPQ